MIITDLGLQAASDSLGSSGESSGVLLWNTFQHFTRNALTCNTSCIYHYLSFYFILHFFKFLHFLYKIITKEIPWEIVSSAFSSCKLLASWMTQVSEWAPIHDLWSLTRLINPPNPTIEGNLSYGKLYTTTSESYESQWISVNRVEWHSYFPTIFHNFVI